MAEDKVSNHHPQYDTLSEKRAVFHAVRDTDTIRATGEANLPKYPAEASKDYTARLNSSTIDALVYGGIDAFSGAVFEGDINTEDVSAKLTDYLENIDNRGNHLNVFAREVFEASFDGAAVIVADMPAVTEEASRIQATYGAEANTILDLRPYLILYKQDSVINWRYAVNEITKNEELTLLVIRCETEKAAGRFTTETEVSYRVWYLDNGVVGWEVWVEQGEKKEPVLMQYGTLAGFEQIPAAVVGCLSDEPKLLAESRLEIKAYQKESSFDTIEYLSVPTFYTKGYDGEEALALGAAAHLKLPTDGDVGFAQIDAAGHTSLKETIANVKDYIKARLNLIASETASGDKTATEVAISDRDKQARLTVWAEELKDGLELALSFMGQFLGLGKDEAGSIKLVTRWDMAQQLVLSPQDVTAKASLVMDNLMSEQTFVELMAEGGQYPEDVDAEEELKRIKADAEKAVTVRPVIAAQNMPGGNGNAITTNAAGNPQQGAAIPQAV